jgi:hypothetical protein
MSGRLKAQIRTGGRVLEPHNHAIRFGAVWADKIAYDTVVLCWSSGKSAETRAESLRDVRS